MSKNRFNKSNRTLNPKVAWSKLKAKTESLFVEDLKLKIYCCANIPNQTYWLMLNGEKIWDFPLMRYEQWEMLWGVSRPGTTGPSCGYRMSSYFSVLLREYINTPIKELLEKDFYGDKVGITQILKAADRRIGKKKLAKVIETYNETAQKIYRTRNEIGRK